VTKTPKMTTNANTTMIETMTKTTKNNRNKKDVEIKTRWWQKQQ